MRWLRLTACAAALWSGGLTPAAGQHREDLPLSHIFRTESLAEVRRDAAARARLTVVVVGTTNPKHATILPALLDNLTFRAWLHWHAEVKVVHPEDVDYQEVARLLERKGAAVGVTPVAVVFMPDGSIKVIPDPELSGFRYEPIEVGRYSRERRASLSPLELLLQCDIILERCASIAPAWLELHEEMNPPPPPPPLMLWAGESDGLGKPWEAGDSHANPVRAIADARELMEMAYLYDATGAYTWLWENLETLDPALRPTRLLTLTQAMRTLADRDDGARERLVKVADSLCARLLWMDWHEWLAWIIAAQAAGDDASVIDTIGSFFGSIYEEAMMPAHHEAAVNLITFIADRWVDPWRVQGDEIEFVTDQVRRLVDERPRRATPEEWGTVVALRRDVLLIEAVRGHVALLKAGRDAEAFEVARLALATLDGDPAARTTAMRAFLWAAAAEGVIGAGHEAWIGEQAEVLRSMFRADVTGEADLSTPPATRIDRSAQDADGPAENRTNRP